MMPNKKNRPFVRVIYGATGLGLRKDADMVRDLLENNACDVELVALPFRPRLARLLYYWERLKLKLPRLLAHFLHRLPMWAAAVVVKRADLQIHLQNPSPAFLGAGKINWLIPNQEWARLDQLHYLGFVDLILCKTRTAESIYRHYSSHVTWTGFSNRDFAVSPKVPADPYRYRRFLHVGGNTLYKGTDTVVETWRRNPQWPSLDLVVSKPDRFSSLPANIRIWSQIDDDTLASLREACGIVLAPSEVEGFGHVLLEGMAWGAVVVTTNAPPMNELITPERGMPVEWVTQAPVRLGTRYSVSAEALEATVEKLLASQIVELEEIGNRAKLWVVENHQRFVSNFETVLKEQMER